MNKYRIANPNNKEVLNCKSRTTESEFIHVTYFGMKRYIFNFSSIESIKEFSYEEKD